MMNMIWQLAGELANEDVRKCKEEGRPVLGYTCVFMPVEIMEAAGIMPYRLRALGQAQTEIADAHLSRFNCSFCRSCLQLGLDGGFDFLDGVIETNGCDHLRGMFENWFYVKPPAFTHYLKVPHLADEESVAYFAGELRKFAEAIQQHFDVDVTDDGLCKAMTRQKQIREKLHRLYQLRAKDKPALTGAEALAVVLAGSAIAAERFETMLDGVLEERENHEIDCRVRLLLGGSATDELEFIQQLESDGAVVVADALCYGARAFMPLEIDETLPPYQALAKMIMGNVLCPRMFADYPARLDFMLETIEEAKVDGAVLVHNKFCDVHGIENVLLRHHIEEKKIPVLTLEKEYGAKADLGRMKTRVQAFLERIGKR